MYSASAIPMAIIMPGTGPSVATPRNAAIESQNSQRWIRNRRPSSLNSNRPTADAITTPASAAFGRSRSSCGANINIRAIASAPTTPVSWVFEPLASATGVRDELLLIGKPWKIPAATFATPSPNIS
jgi:hypothetical protein